MQRLPGLSFNSGPRIPKNPSSTATTNSIGMIFVRIPSGTFIMGAGSNDPNYSPYESAHRVTISEPFYLSQTPVTLHQFHAVTGRLPRAPIPHQPPHSDAASFETLPATFVNWHEANFFCQRLSLLREETRSRRLYTLPTEAQWEYACRAGTRGRFFFGNYPCDLGDYGWYLNNSASRPQPVGAKLPNAWGLFDMLGNIWEWCYDFAGTYDESKTIDPTGPAKGSHRIIRGGSFSSLPLNCRACKRSWEFPSRRCSNVGFRIVMKHYQ